MPLSDCTASLAPGEPLAALRSQYQQQKQAVVAELLQPGHQRRRIHTLLHTLAQHADDMLRLLWQRAGLPGELALLGVGGFGRDTLFPASDVDVLLLTPAGQPIDGDDPLKQCIEGFVSSCWDVGLEIGFSLRSIDEALADAQEDITVQTAMLESRWICGDRALAARFEQRFMATLDPLAFLHAKTLEMRQRHARFDNTPYALEPNCKESPGGLRDLHVILWVARAAGLGNSWAELAKNGIATPLEVRALRHCEAELSLIRARLHAISGRHEDRLIFDLQTSVAELFGYRSENTQGSRLPMRASEQLMRQYYWCAKGVTQLNQILLLDIEERLNPGVHRLRPINEHFFDKGGMIEVASDDLYIKHPHAILQTFLLYETQVGLKDLSARTLRALYNARNTMNAAFRRDPVNRQLFMQIIQQPAGITHALRLMNRTSVLGRYLWPFRRIVGQMQHDLFHVYTVDQHILMVVRNMRRFFLAEHAHEYPYCSSLAAGWDKPWLLYLAALFHDIGKGRGGDHSEIGAREMRKFCRQHDIAKADTDLLVFLIREHLSMSQIAQKQDLSDPEVIAAFAQRVGSERYLTALYLLTVADIRGTSPKVWNAWKGKLLEDLYRATARMLGGTAPDPQAETELCKGEARVLLSLDPLPASALETFWRQMDFGYFLRHSADELAWHARHLAGHSHAPDAPPQVIARKSVIGEGIQVTIYASDRADLFARICSYFDQAEYEILDARIHTTRDGYALDTFQVALEFQDKTPEETAHFIEGDLSHYLQQNTPLPEPRARRVSRRVRHFPVNTRIRLEPDDKAQHWLLTLSASDRPGLLYSIAWTLAHFHLGVNLAKITTLGERAEDSFLIEGRGLREDSLQQALERELMRRCAALQ
ncbi:[protein-PII] uridylyltransferase [Corticibacter populi]|uniref:Bifunctional uridylyltransferase/uridylyl-removing enzyme n=1 Tax=Corticibacter populi TaxID=1550736 RepID=A0A3M6QU47_9BURK|nr:[protein-PII] uridylyltransferase [Corticibacter populi]RMX06536.1 [protein-PII] uridylyltransferase [Corticibacter populi]RZS31900.1 UTP--GlnB (protein PII) uridylyltransferase GlnD [Corticibacter populi]